MSKRLNTLAIALIAVALAACGEQDAADDHPGHDHENGHAHTDEDAATSESTDGTSNDQADDADSEETDADDSAAGDYPQATIDGTMTLFMDALGQGEYRMAMDVADNTSIEVQEAFTERAEQLTYPHPTNPNVDEAYINAIRDMASRPFQNSQWNVIDKGQDEATVQLTLESGRSREMTLVYRDQAWWVFPREGFLDWVELDIGGYVRREGAPGLSPPQQPDQEDQQDQQADESGNGG